MVFLQCRYQEIPTSKTTVLGRSQKLFLLPEGGSFPDKDNLIAESITVLNMRSSIDITAFYSSVLFDDPRSVVNIVTQFLIARVYVYHINILIAVNGATASVCNVAYF